MLDFNWCDSIDAFETALLQEHICALRRASVKASKYFVATSSFLWAKEQTNIMCFPSLQSGDSDGELWAALF